jgi:TonB-dependent starch-binding outer membrane protein SusC
VSYLGRVNYNLKNRYLLSFSVRADGSSKFASDNKYSVFPSGAFAWKLSNEPFMRKIDVVSEAKLRIGYGRTGNQAIQPYQTFGRFGATANLLSDGQGGAVTAIIPQNLQNVNLIWETTDQFNTGLDFGLFNNRLEGSFDAYYKVTRDLLQELSIGPSAGFNTVITNQGSLANKGIELGLDWRILQDKFNWTISGNISVNRAEIIDLGLTPAQYGTQTFSAYLGRNVSGGTVFRAPANIFIEGYAPGLFWGYQTDGIVDDQTELATAPKVQGTTTQLGDVRYVDQNGDGNITDQDLTIIGNPNPDFTFGLGSKFGFKNFALEVFFNGVQGNDIANANLPREDFALGSPENIRVEAYEGAWRPGSIGATHPRLNYPLQGDFTDRMVEDASFVRLTYVNLTYTVPQKAFKRVSNINLFVSGQNLWLLTNYRGFDPEVNSFSFDPSRIGIDLGSFPNQKAFVAGLNITF